VKVGPEFLEGIETDRERCRAVSEAAVTAHRHGQRVIAQGVERVTTLQLLEGLEVDEAQGYALGPPESLESLIGTPV
jgi:EAL domain-containing protein (putative c-di-GMP-specific phosphodiesterase class I)